VLEEVKRAAGREIGSRLMRAGLAAIEGMRLAYTRER